MKWISLHVSLKDLLWRRASKPVESVSQCLINHTFDVICMVWPRWISGVLRNLDCIFQDDLIQVCISSLGMSLLELRKRSLGRAACTSCVPQFCVNQVISLAYLSLSASMTCYPWDSLFIPRCQMADICCSTCSHRRAHVTGLQSLFGVSA